MQNSPKDKLAKLLYEFNLANGSNLLNVDNLNDAIEIGYNQNPDVFSIVNYLATLYTRVPKKPYKKDKQGKYVEITDPNIISLINKANSNQTISEFDKERYIFYLITGNSFVYAPKIQAGNQKGQLTDIGRKVMPSQHVEIISGGWMEPVKEYIIDYNYTKNITISANEVIHNKITNLKYMNGESLYGISPVKVASNIIQSQNNAYSITASTMKRGFPSGILTKITGEQGGDDEIAQERINIFKKIWRKFYGKSKNSGEPIITEGDVRWIEMGFKNFKELQTIETSQEGRRILCNIWGIPSLTMNDIQGTTFNNQTELRKVIYTQRIMPDIQYFCEKENADIWSNYGFEVWPDYSGIEELQSNRKELAEWINIVQQAGAMLNAEEILKILDLDIPNDPSLKTRFINMGKVPVEQVLSPTDLNIDAALKKFEIDNYIK